MTEERKRNIFRLVSIILLVVTALNALAAGFSFITEPYGSGLGMGVDYLRPSAPFKDYFIPGLVLFFMIGFGCLGVAYLAWKKKGRYPLLVFFAGSILIVWIVVQLSMVRGFHPLHAIIGSIGILLASLGWILNRR